MFVTDYMETNHECLLAFAERLHEGQSEEDMLGSREGCLWREKIGKYDGYLVRFGKMGIVISFLILIF